MDKVASTVNHELTVALLVCRRRLLIRKAAARASPDRAAVIQPGTTYLRTV